MQEICRLVMKTKEAADLIDGQEIILLVGETGVGKSTTIQFLAGAKMQEKQVEIAPGKFLEHIEPIEYNNPYLREVISSPFGKSETRYIKPIVISLKDIYGGTKSGSINLCDSPGFEDTSGPEVDIANSIGVIAALQNCKSVKILALSSYKSLGDRGQGIQKLAHTLVNMIRDIEDRLNTVVYTFTKYPLNKDVNAMLMNIKNSAIEQDPSLKTDTAFLAVLNDMIEKTEERAYKIDPILGDPKKIIDKLIRTKSILYPGEVFQFSISSKTQSVIQNQIQNIN